MAKYVNKWEGDIRHGEKKMQILLKIKENIPELRLQSGKFPFAMRNFKKIPPKEGVKLIEVSKNNKGYA